jgi:hypothetical protein
VKNKIKSLSRRPVAELITEMLIMPDGRILVHNLTPAFARLLKELNPDDEQLSSRLSRRNEVKADVTRQPLPSPEQCCSVSTLQGARGPNTLKRAHRTHWSRSRNPQAKSSDIEASHEFPN